MMKRQVTAEDIRELLTSTSMDPTLVEWLNEDDDAVVDMIEVVSGALFSDVSYSRYYQPYAVLATASELRQVGDWDIDNPTAEDCEAFAAQINENR